VGSFLYWLKSTGESVEQDLRKGQQQVPDYVAQRTRMLQQEGMSANDARLIAQAEADGGKVRFPAALGTAGRVGTTLVNAAGEQLVETAVGKVPVVKGAVAIKQAWETGTLIGQQGTCAAPPKQDGDSSASLYVGRTTNGAFGDLPPGAWVLVFTAPGWEPSGAEGVAITEGGTTEVDGGTWIKLGPATTPPPDPGTPGPKCAELKACCPGITDSAYLKGECDKAVSSNRELNCSVMLTNLSHLQYCA
jgi:hypothetical protein